MTDEEFDVKGRELADYFGNLEVPFVLVALDQSGKVNRNHMCSNLPKHLAVELVLDVAVSPEEYNEQVD